MSKVIYDGDFYNISDSGKITISKNITPFTDIAICGKDEAQELCKDEPNKWCAVSICLPPKNSSFIVFKEFQLKNTKKIAQYYFHDISSKRQGGTMCEDKDIRSFLKFSEECYGEALMVHCAAGIARSTAVAFLIILNSIKDKVKNPVEQAINIVYQIRPIAYPNTHILEIGMPLVARSEKELIAWWRELYNSSTWQRIRG